MKTGSSDVHEQKAMASCYDEPTKDHTGIYRTVELVK